MVLIPRSDRELRRLARSYELIAQSRMRGHRSATLRMSLAALRRRLEYPWLPHYFGDSPAWRLRLRRWSGSRTLPDFALIGPIKCGSSDFAIQLHRHPCLLPPLTKEIFTTDPEAWRPHYPTVRQMRRVAEAYGVARSGYLAPFMQWQQLARDFHRVRPEAKIIIALRDPVWRGVSHWKWEVLLAGRALARHAHHLRNFRDFVRFTLAVYPSCTLDFISRFPFPHAGIYDPIVKLWIDVFGRDNVLVVDMGEYFRDRSPVLRRVFEFLELPELPLPESDLRVNENPLKLPAPDEESLDELSAFYRPFNEQLWQLLGERFDWRQAR